MFSFFFNITPADKNIRRGAIVNRQLERMKRENIQKSPISKREIFKDRTQNKCKYEALSKTGVHVKRTECTKKNANIHIIKLY